MQEYPDATVGTELDQEIYDLYLEELNSFWVKYQFPSKQFQISPMKEDYIAVPWDVADLCAGQCEQIVFRPDIPLMNKFLDFSNTKPGESKRVTKLRLYKDEHNYAWFKLVMLLFYRTDGSLDYFYLLCTDIDSKIKIERRLKFASNSDSLTHFPNLNLFQIRVHELLTENPSLHYQLIYFDIDHFRSINAVFGAKEGDNLLKYLAVRIQEYLEDEDQITYSRVGSDNFIICIPQEIYSIDDFVAHMQWSVSAYPKNFDVTLTIGIYRISEEDALQKTPVNVLIDRAASAHSSVKGNYLNRIGYYDDRLRQQERLEMLVTSEMNQALASKQFVVYFQPKVEMETGVVVGAEALIRWQHPVRGLIAPIDFIPIFERNGFILELDGYVIYHTCKYIRKWLDEGKKVLPISVNLSRANLYNSRLLEQIDSCINEFNIPLDLIEFELLESSFVTDNYNLAKLMSKLRAKHFTILMDDFGNGYSALNALTTLPVDVIKIDRGFLPVDRNDTKALLLLKYIVDMINGLKLEIVVEGVETREQADYLLEFGCRIAQGFYFYKPLPVAEYEKLFES